MSRQTTTYGAGRRLGRAGILLGVLSVSLWTSPTAHAGDGGLLGDTTEVVGGAAGQVVDPVLQTVQSPVPQPVQQAVEPAVPQTVEPVLNQPAQTAETVVRTTEQTAQTVVRNTEQTAQSVVRNTEQTAQAVVRNTEQTAQPVVRNTEQTAQPVVRNTEQTAQATVRSGEQASEPVVGGAEPADRRDPTPGAPQPPVTASTAGSHTGGASVRGAQHVPSRAPGVAQRRAPSAAVASLVDLAPRAGAARPFLGGAPQVYVLRDSYDPRSDQRVWMLTNKLMHMWAGEDVPGGVDAGLPGAEGPGLWRPGAFDPVPLVLGLLLGFLSLLLARRSRQSTGFTARPTR